MPVRPDAPLRKVTLNLYEADCRFMEKQYGHGWTVEVRDQVNLLCNGLRTEASPRRRTLGDLADE